MPSIVIDDEEPQLAGIPIARARSGAVVGERELIERRLQQTDERAAWHRLRGIKAALAA